ncbi:hypothetical protein PtrSN002B_003889 [Pyrenophora tritici-repentis]|nr:hypothetical protein A1F99_132040 [Pyrenophora tritici-repentis]KAI1554520.1 hypothetical protein PtrSN002B_003889 [Pyrenophora tritici-repentis]PZD27627.1 hypothetical protein A1F96_06597 [Pyrenophora tritici-repentis]PZD42490.1 hypothetical protein A1F97_03595 [Pyrenophora tritici-repentis]
MEHGGLSDDLGYDDYYTSEDKIEGNDYESKSEEYKYRGDDLIEGNDKSESEEDDE